MVINFSSSELRWLIEYSPNIRYDIWAKFKKNLDFYDGAKNSLDLLKAEMEVRLKEREASSEALEKIRKAIDDIYAKFPELDTEQ